jgi:hypothetical protein
MASLDVQSDGAVFLGPADSTCEGKIEPEAARRMAMAILARSGDGDRQSRKEMAVAVLEADGWRFFPPPGRGVAPAAGVSTTLDPENAELAREYVHGYALGVLLEALKSTEDAARTRRELLDLLAKFPAPLEPEEVH